MFCEGEEEPSNLCVRSQFTTTHWSVVIQAGQADSPQAAASLEQLCRRYWFPLYAAVRRKGYAREEAEDLVQSFFARLLEKNYVAQADRERGKFRTFLLAALEHFLANEWNRQQALRRGGRQTFVALDAQNAEARYTRERFHELSPEKLFDRRWAAVLLEQAHQALGHEYVAAGKGALFAALQPCLTGESPPDGYRKLAAQLDLSEGAVRMAVHRLRRAFGEQLRNEVAMTVSQPAQVEEEMQHLFAILRE